MQPHYFARVNRLHLPPELADFLFLVIVREDFAEAFQSQHFRWYFVAPENRLKLGRWPCHQAKPEVAGKRRTRILQFVLPIEFPQGVHGRPLLLAQPLAHLRPERRPMVRADIGFKACRDERAHRRKHRFAAVHRHRAWRRCCVAWTRRGRRRRSGRSLRLHLCRCWRLPCRRQCYCRAQSRLKYSSTSFPHSYRRSSHSEQRLFLSRLATFPGTGGHACETSLSSRNAAAFSQFTVGSLIRQGIASISLPAFRCNDCLSSRHLLTVRMPPNSGGMAPSDACRPHEKNRTPSRIGHRHSDFHSPTCRPARA